MDHQNTIPSILGPVGGVDRASARKLVESEPGLAFKLAFWVAVAVIVVCAARFLMR
jgi:hypothetical protein